MFKPSSIFLTDRSKVVLLLWINFVICVSYLSLLCCVVCSLQPCDYLMGRAEYLALLCVGCSCVCVILPYGVPGRLWYLIVSIPDLCLPLYFYASYLKMQ